MSFSNIFVKKSNNKYGEIMNKILLKCITFSTTIQNVTNNSQNLNLIIYILIAIIVLIISFTLFKDK